MASEPERKPFSDPLYKNAIAKLAETERVRAALGHIRAIEPLLHDNLVELTMIPAPPFAEEARAQRFAELLREAGLVDVSIDAIGNAIGRRPGRSSHRVVAYTAHLDTVFPPGTEINIRAEGDTLFAPGVADNTRGLVVVLGVLRALEYAKIETDADILFVGNVGEEGLGDLRGIKHLVSNGDFDIDAVIAVDGGRTNRIVYGGVGSHRYRVTFNGAGGHSWGAFGIANPHHALGRTIATFSEAAQAITSKEGSKASYSVGRIGGGTSVNSIAYESWMEVDMRSGDQARLDELDSALHAAVAQALQKENATRSAGDELLAEVVRIGTRPAARSDPGSSLVQHAMAAIEHYGLEPNLAISSTDASYPISIGIPAITMSRGGISKNGHSLNESWENKDGHIAIQAGLLTLLAEAEAVLE